MSFADLEQGNRQNSSGGDDGGFESLANKVSLQIFKINGNTTGIGKLVDLLGTARDTPAIRKKLHDLTEATRELVKAAPEDLKAMAACRVDSRQRKVEQAKVSRDFQAAVASFQQMQQRSAKQQRTFVEKAKAAAHDEDNVSHHSSSKQQPAGSTRHETPDVELEDQSSVRVQQQQQAQVQAEGVQDSEVEYQEQLIEEREGEIREIEAGIHELNDIFRDLGTIVHEQQSMLDNIETNVNSIADDTDQAADELTSAHQYQKNRGKRMCYLLMIFVVVVVVVLLVALA